MQSEYAIGTSRNANERTRPMLREDRCHNYRTVSNTLLAPLRTMSFPRAGRLSYPRELRAAGNNLPSAENRKVVPRGGGSEENA